MVCKFALRLVNCVSRQAEIDQCEPLVRTLDFFVQRWSTERRKRAKRSDISHLMFVSFFLLFFGICRGHSPPPPYCGLPMLFFHNKKDSKLKQVFVFCFSFCFSFFVFVFFILFCFLHENLDNTVKETCSR